MEKHFKIYVFPHVHKFMLMHYTHQRGIFKTEEYSTLGKVVALALFDHRKRKTDNDQQRDRITTPVTLQLTVEQCRYQPRLFKLQRINLDIDAIFKEHLIAAIRTHKQMGNSTRHACINFLNLYNIDSTEYSLDNAYKHWQRYGEGK